MCLSIDIAVVTGDLSLVRLDDEGRLSGSEAELARAEDRWGADSASLQARNGVARGGVFEVVPEPLSN